MLFAYATMFLFLGFPNWDGYAIWDMSSPWLTLTLLIGLGFREIGVYRHHARLDGRWRDVVIVERLLGPATDDQPTGDEAAVARTLAWLVELLGRHDVPYQVVGGLQGIAGDLQNRYLAVGFHMTVYQRTCGVIDLTFPRKDT